MTSWPRSPTPNFLPVTGNGARGGGGEEVRRVRPNTASKKHLVVSPLTDLVDAAGQRPAGQEGLVLTRPGHGAHEVGVGGEDAGALLREVDAGHGGHVVDVVVLAAPSDGRHLSTRPYEPPVCGDAKRLACYSFRYVYVCF